MTITRTTVIKRTCEEAQLTWQAYSSAGNSKNCALATAFQFTWPSLNI